jgi:hypothetical protein
VTPPPTTILKMEGDTAQSKAAVSQDLASQCCDDMLTWPSAQSTPCQTIWLVSLSWQTLSIYIAGTSDVANESWQAEMNRLEIQHIICQVRQTPGLAAISNNP